jgi:hypothetical protein
MQFLGKSIAAYASLMLTVVLLLAIGLGSTEEACCLPRSGYLPCRNDQTECRRQQRLELQL